MTRSGKYTDVARERASRSSALPYAHVIADVGDGDDQAASRRRLDGLGVHRVVEILASAPSMVTSGRARKSSRPAWSAAVTSRSKPVRLFDDLGREFLRQVVPEDGKARRQDPRAADHRAIRRCDHAPGTSPCGRLVTSTMTSSPSSRAVPLAHGHLDGVPMARDLRAQRAPRLWHRRARRRRCVSAHPPMRWISRAMRRPRSFIPTASTSTRSSCISVAVSARASTKGADPSSGMHQHVAVGASANATRDPFAVARDREPVGTFDGLAVAHHRAQALCQRVALCVGVQSQSFGKARRAQRLRRLAPDASAAVRGSRSDRRSATFQVRDSDPRRASWRRVWQCGGFWAVTGRSSRAVSWGVKGIRTMHS